MNKRLLRVARYLAKSGFYSEAAQIKKMASGEAEGYRGHLKENYGEALDEFLFDFKGSQVILKEKTAWPPGSAKEESWSAKDFFDFVKKREFIITWDGELVKDNKLSSIPEFAELYISEVEGLSSSGFGRGEEFDEAAEAFYSGEIDADDVNPNIDDPFDPYAVARNQRAIHGEGVEDMQRALYEAAYGPRNRKR